MTKKEYVKKIIKTIVAAFSVYVGVAVITGLIVYQTSGMDGVARVLTAFVVSTGLVFAMFGGSYLFIPTAATDRKKEEQETKLEKDVSE